ncbi:hypothetical protein QOZ80_2BG0191180 [Eleusine coracana subsp. coracana]|nr:hypothetical protein QOZ80_2BG0191180 [Eleusine coracana subsp. coracana]
MLVEPLFPTSPFHPQSTPPCTTAESPPRLSTSALQSTSASAALSAETRAPIPVSGAGRPGGRSRSAGEMAPKPATSGAFGVKRVVFSVGAMSGAARRRLRKRLGSEIDAVRDLIRKAEVFPDVGAAAEAAGAAAAPGESAPMEVDGSGGEAKRRKMSPLVVKRTEELEQKRAAVDEARARLAERLASLAAALPDRVVAFLQNQYQRAGGDEECRVDGGESEADTRSMMKGGALFHLKLLLDRFAPAASTPEKDRGRVAALDVSGGASGLSQQHHDANASCKTVPPVDKDGASCGVQLSDIAEEYGELVCSIGVLLLSPLQRKHVDLADRVGDDDEYVDIVGDASPVVFPCATSKAVKNCSSPSTSSGSSASSSSTDSSDDTSSSSSDSDSSSESEDSVGGPAAPPGFPRKGNYTSQQAPKLPGQEKVQLQIAEREVVQQDQRAPPTPTVRPITISPPEPPLVLPKGNHAAAWPPEKTAVQIAKSEEVRNQCAAPEPAARPIIIDNQPAPLDLALPEGKNNTTAQPPEAVQTQRAAVIAPTEPAINCIPPAPPAAAAVPNHNGNAPAQPPPPAPAQDAIAEPEDPYDPALPDLIARAQEAMERRRREETSRERARARRELLEVERAAPPDDRVHPRDMEMLGIAAVEHVVSIAGEGSNGGRRRGGGCPTLMQFLGLFLKAADDGSSGEEGAAADMDVEEGEIQ